MKRWRILNSQRARDRFTVILSYSFLIVLSVIAVFPLFWMFSSALRPSNEIWMFPPRLLPSALSFKYYERIMTYTGFLQNLKNSVIISLSTTALAILFSVAAGYSISRFRYKGRKFLSRVILVAYMFPPVLLIIPLFKIMVNVGLINTRIGLIIAQLAFAFPYAAWLLNAYFSTIPKELEEAAYVDGCGPVGALTRIIIPLAAPGIVAAAIFSFILSWRDFLFSFIIASEPSIRPLSVGLYEQVGGELMVWGDIMAWSSLMTLPILLFFILLQKQIVYGLTAGAVKG